MLPDMLANAGGVTISYFEWVQNLQDFFWSEDGANAKLERNHAVPLCAGASAAAYLLAVQRAAEATLTRGIYS